MLNKFVVVAMGLALFATVAMAQQNAPATAASAPPTVAAVLDRQLSMLEKELVPMGTDMPESKFNFVPSGGDFKGVRGFGDQLKHVATANYRLGGAILKEKPPMPADMASLKSKDEIMKFVQDSFAYAHKAFATITDKNLVEEVPALSGNGTTTRLWLATFLLGHDRDHYGQLVVYLRMNGIIPPASRH
ncbi:MAG: DinB family protein [Candidatus Korobacteraceae bacterium]